MSYKNNWENQYNYIELKKYNDERGFLFEILRFFDQKVPNNGYIYTFSIEPNMRRGDHFHEKKHEWFTCVYGEATVLLTTGDEDNKSFIISSDKPGIIHTAPGTTHALINNDKNIPAVIVSYGSVAHNHDDPDTFKRIAYEGFGG